MQWKCDGNSTALQLKFSAMTIVVGAIHTIITLNFESENTKETG